MNKFIFIFMLAVAGYANTSFAEVFVRVDDAGNATYTNIKDGADMQEPADSDVQMPSSKSSKAYKKDPELVIAPEVQSARDKKRKEILQSELDSEVALLKTDKDPDAKQSHERNIGLLRKELVR